MYLYHFFLLMAWVSVGAALRFQTLLKKPLWADEFSTVVFGVGHSFRVVNVNQWLSPEQLFHPIQWGLSLTAMDSARRLLTESNHPPLYFMLTHHWIDGGMTLWPYVSDDVPDIGWMVRSLSALCGILAIPSLYGVAWWLWRSPLIAHLAAILMACSPFGLYLSQEARHYTLALLWIIGSLGCLVAVVRCIRDRRTIPTWLGFTWLGFNALGLATHYFFVFALMAELIAIVGWWSAWVYGQGRSPSHVRGQIAATRPDYPQYQHQQAHSPVRQGGRRPLLQHQTAHAVHSQPQHRPAQHRPAQHRNHPALNLLQRHNYGRLGLVVLGTSLAGGVWLPFVLGSNDGSELVRWIQRVPQGWDDWTSPAIHLFASMTSMVYLLPIQGVGTGIVIGSSLIVIGVLLRTLWVLLPLVWRHLTSLPLDESPPTVTKDTLPLLMVGGIIIAAGAIIAAINYGLGFRVAEVFRYHFFYFPALLLAIAWGLAQLWPRFPRIVGITLGLSLCGALTVSYDLGYQKIHRPDKAVQIITQHSESPLFLAISHQSHGQTGRMMAIAHALDHPNRSQQGPTAPLDPEPHFFLDHQPCDRPGDQNCNEPSPILRQSLRSLPPAADLWLINYLGQTDLTQERCNHQHTRRVDGYKLQHYQCSPEG